MTTPQVTDEQIERGTMIGCTKLLCGTATVSDAIKMRRADGKVPARMLQFSGTNRPLQAFEKGLQTGGVRPPLVVWNATNRCNLRCKHCYISAGDMTTGRDAPAAQIPPNPPLPKGGTYDNLLKGGTYDEMTTAEAEEFITDLAEMRVPVLLFSGGEPLIRSDIFHLSRFATDRGLRVILSTNGTLITSEVADSIKRSGMQYVGVSFDGLRDTHDEFRCKAGAFDRALEGIRNCMRLDIKTGIRFTISKLNKEDLPGVINLLEQEGIPRFCMYHLVYSGRGREIMDMDTSREEKLETMRFLVDRTLELYKKGVETELLTVDNHADGVYIYKYLLEKQPDRADEVMQLLKMHGGCSAGTKFANVDPLGNIHPCQFWQHVSLGNVRERKFSDIWNDEGNGFLKNLRRKDQLLKGRCGQCIYKTVCGGCRVRAEVVHGDIWAEDPACYLG